MRTSVRLAAIGRQVPGGPPGLTYDELLPAATALLHLPEIAREHPDARVIHVVRDGRDVALSLLLDEDQRARQLRGERDLGVLGARGSRRELVPMPPFHPKATVPVPAPTAPSSTAPSLAVLGGIVAIYLRMMDWVMKGVK